MIVILHVTRNHIMASLLATVCELSLLMHFKLLHLNCTAYHPNCHLIWVVVWVFLLEIRSACPFAQLAFVHRLMSKAKTIFYKGFHCSPFFFIAFVEDTRAEAWIVQLEWRWGGTNTLWTVAFVHREVWGSRGERLGRGGRWKGSLR